MTKFDGSEIRNETFGIKEVVEVVAPIVTTVVAPIVTEVVKQKFEERRDRRSGDR